MSSVELGPNFLVIADLHGERELAEKAIQMAEDFSATPVFLGDIVNGPDTKGTIDTIMSLGREAVSIVGNHEWVLRNALFSPEVEASVRTRDLAWSNKRRLLESYGLKREGRAADAVSLRAALEEAGHWEWLEDLPPFFETDEFIALHSGPLLDTPWQFQREKILRQSEPITRLSEAPPQIVDEAHKLSGLEDTPEIVDQRVFVTGHKHTGLAASERKAKGRVCLASRVGGGQPLYTWESFTGHIHEIKIT